MLIRRWGLEGVVDVAVMVAMFAWVVCALLSALFGLEKVKNRFLFCTPNTLHDQTAHSLYQID